MTTYFKLVKGATKIKMAPPKQKYVEPILLGTSDPGDFREIVKGLDTRISDTAWTIVYKSLIVLHLMIREGDKDVALNYYSDHPSFFQLSEITKSAKWSSGDIRALERYNHYLKIRCEEYAHIRTDYVQEGYSSLKLVNGKGIGKALDHVESLEIQIGALIKNRYSQFDLNNDLLLYAFKLLVQDLLSLYNSLNEGIITLLESFFELSHKDAEKTLDLYKSFVDLTEHVVKYLKTGKQVGLKIPVIKHITTKLIRSLEEHLREDEKTHSTFVGGESGSSNIDDNNTSSVAQRKLEQIRKQKKLLEKQLQNQQLLVSPSIPQQPYNPFGVQQQQQQQQPQESFTFEQQVPQSTGNPFLMQQNTQVQPQPQLQMQPQPQVQLPQQQVNYVQQAPVAPAMTAPDLSNQQTGFYASNTQLTPTFTGAGFGGYSSAVTTQNDKSNSQLAPMQTGSNNPFSLDNIASESNNHELVNPFSQPNFTSHEQQQQLHSQIQNPFQAQNQTHLTAAHTTPNLMTTPTSNFTNTYDNVQYTQQQQYAQPAAAQQVNYTQNGFIQQQGTGYNPFQLQQLQQQQQAQAQAQAQMQMQQLQQQQQQQQQQPVYNPNSNLIDY